MHLKNVKWARNILGRNIPSLNRLAQVFQTAMIGNFLGLLGIRIHPFSESSLGQTLRHEIESLPAAHSLLEVVPSFFEGIFDGEHRVVQLRHQLIPLAFLDHKGPARIFGHDDTFQLCQNFLSRLGSDETRFSHHAPHAVNLHPFLCGTCTRFCNPVKPPRLMIDSALGTSLMG